MNESRAAKKARQQLLTEGKPYKKIIGFTVPILIGSLFQQLYSMADALIISRTLGVEAFAGVSSTGSITFLILGFAQGLTAGLAISISQSFGAEDYQAVKRHYVHNMAISLAVVAVLTALSLLGADWLLSIMQTPADILDYARRYLVIIFGGMVVSMLYNFFANTLRALGDSKSPLYFLFVASGLNIVLDIVLIRFTPLGVSGAALATVISQGVSAALCLILILKKVEALSLKGYREPLQMRVILQNLRLGLPMAFQSSIIALGTIFMTYATNRMGSVAVASYSVGSKIDGIAVEPLRSLGMAMITYTAQNYGAGKYKRILQGVWQSITIAAVLSAVLGLVMFFAGRGLVYLFLGTDDDVILSQGALLLFVHGVCYMILALLFIFRYVTQGLGQTLMPTIAGFMELVMRTVAAFILVPQFEFLGAAVSTPLSWLGAMVPVAVAYIIAAKKLHRKVADE